MLFESIADNISLLESLTLFSPSDTSAAPGSPEHYFLSCLQRLKEDDLEGATSALQQLAAALHVQTDSPQLEPLRTLTNIKSWQAGDKEKLKTYVIKELGLKFEEEGTSSQTATTFRFGVPQTIPGSADETPPAPSAAAAASPAPASLPSHIDSNAYTQEAFQTALDSSSNKPVDEEGVISFKDPSTLLQAAIDGTLGVKAAVRLLQDNSIPAAALPVTRLAQLLSEWQSDWASTAWQASTRWQESPVLQWAAGHWDCLTAEQAAAVRPVLPGPPYGSNPDVDRPYVVARIKKALAGAAAGTSTPSASADRSAAAIATGSNITAAGVDGTSSSRGGGSGAATGAEGDSTVLWPWHSGSDAAAAAVRLERVLAECDELGPTADWIRVHALYAQLQLQQQQQPAVSTDLLNTFINLLRRCTWSHGGPFGLGQQQQQHPLHVACFGCGVRPIEGPRFRSRSNFDINLCARCVGRPEAAAAAPYDEVKVDDSIYMLPEVDVPPVLTGLPNSPTEVQPELKKLIQSVVLQAAVASGGSCPADAGLQLPASPWSASVVAAAHLLSGIGDTAEWARQYEESGGDLAALRAESELAFAPHSRSTYSLADDVVLELHTKNIGTEGVLVKVYELICWKLYTSTQADADLNLELAGVVPTSLITLQTPADPMVRCQHRVPLNLSGVPGVWLVEVVAGSRRLRARISKGGLRLLHRPSVAGQELTVLDEDWRPVQGVKVWCDGKDYTPRKPDPSSTGTTAADGPEEVSSCNKVLLPFARQECNTSLVVAADVAVPPPAAAAGAPAAAAATASKQCAVLVRDFRRLPERYCLTAQLFSHQEALLPGHTVQLLLLLQLQLHGTSAPLRLLQDLQLSLTANTAQGAPVTQVIQDLLIDEASCTAQVSFSLPANTTSLSASLTGRLLLALPGVNGEPDYQDFDLQELLPGGSGLQHSVEIEGARQSSDVWDVYLATTTAATAAGSAGPAAAVAAPPAASSPSGPQYMLQVLGRCGEPPSTPKTLSVLLSHITFSPRFQRRFMVQTGSGGAIYLGSLQGIRDVRAQIEAGVDCVEQAEATAAAAAATSTAGPGGEGLDSGEGSGGVGGQHAGTVRCWSVARPSWWVGGLQEQYVMAEGKSLEIPMTPAAGQSVAATLLQLVSPAVASASSSVSSAQEALVAADISAAHLQLLQAAPQQDGGSSVSSGSSGLGCGSTVTIKIKGLAAGLYRLVLPGLALHPCSRNGAGAGSQWQGSGSWGVQSSYSAVHIHVLPAAVQHTPPAAAGDTQRPAAEAPAETATGANLAGDAGPSRQQEWLYACPDSSHFCGSESALLQPSPPQQLHLSFLTCATTAGLTLEVAGTEQQLQSAQVLLIFSRFLPDSTVNTAQLLPPQLPWSTQHTSAQGFGFSQTLEAQRSGWGFDGSDREGLGFEACPQPCGALARCSYSRDVQLDSAVAYVLQRRAWEAAGGGRRPGVMLDRPSLLLFPHSMRSAAVSTSVLRGGDGGRLVERPNMKKAAAARYGFGAPPAAACGAPPPAMCAMFGGYGGMQQQMAADGDWGGGGPAGFELGRRVVTAKTPVLGFLGNPAAVLTHLQVGPDGRLHIPPDQLQQLLADAAGVPESGLKGPSHHSAAAAGGGAGGAGDAECAAAVDGSGTVSIWEKTGAKVVYAAVYDVRALGQFGAAWCSIQGLPATGCELQGADGAEGGTASSGCSSTLPAAALRDMGLDRPVDPGVVSALSCDVLVLSKAGDSIILDNAEAAEAGVFGSTQQLYHLLAGLLKAADTGALQGLPCPYVPDGAKESASVLLRQWEPLLLQWPQLGPAARQDLLARLASSELLFFMALKDRATYEELLLPLLRCKLPSELTCLEQVLLLQAQHQQPVLPAVQPAVSSSTPPGPPSATASHDARYTTCKQQLLQHWFAPQRYAQLNQLERLLLAALEGQEALLQYSRDLMQQLQSPAEKRGVKRTWMSRERRAVFDFGLLLARSLEQQQSKDDSSSSSPGSEGSGDNDEAEGTAAADEDSDSDFVKVDKVYEPAAEPAGFRFGGPAPGAAPGMMVPPPAPMAAPPPPPMFGGVAARAMAAGYARDLADRAQVAREAADESASVRVPKETKEWAETGWWKCEGPQPQLIPAARFWAEYAEHLATQPPGSPFVPSDPTDVASSTAAVIAALAVTGLPWVGTHSSTSSSSTSSKGLVKASSVGCSRSYAGASLTLTAKDPGLLWVKMMKPIAAISTPGGAAATAVDAAIGAAAAAAGSAADASAGVVPGAAAGSSVTSTAATSVINSVLVVDRLYDPRVACSTDPETGEEVLLSLQPSEQQPLLTGQRYCRSVVVTSTLAAERDLQILVQLPQGAMPLDGSLGTISQGIKLPAYLSTQLQQTFYFPHAGTYQQAPVSLVTVTGRPAWVPSAPPGPLHVVDAPSLPSGISINEPTMPQYLDPAERWRQCINKGDKQYILEFLQSGDLSGATLSDASKFCRDPAFFAAAVDALNSRHVYDASLWSWSVLHQHAPALKQLLENSHLASQLQSQFKVPVGRLLDSVFGSAAPGVPALQRTLDTAQGPGGAGGAAGLATAVGSGAARGAGAAADAADAAGMDGSGSVCDGDQGWGLCQEGLRQLEYWPWVNPYCRPITHSGAVANLPSVLRDNPAIAQHWKAFLLSLLMDVSNSAGSSSSSSTPSTARTPATATSTVLSSSSSSRGTAGKRGLTMQQATAAAVFLLLQDRLDDAEQVLALHGGDSTGESGGQAATTTAAAAAVVEEPSGCSSVLSMQRDYLSAWLALARPLAGSTSTATAAAEATGTAGTAANTAAAVAAAAGGDAVAAADEAREAVAAHAIKLGRAVLDKYQSCAVGPWAKRLKRLASLITQLEQQQSGGSDPAAAAAGRGESPGASACTPQPLLTVISLQGSALKLHVAGLAELQLAAYQIDTELLFTTQPFSSFNASSAAAAPVSHNMSSQNGSADAGLGRVSFVQPTAKVPLQLQYTAAGMPVNDTGTGSTGGSGASSTAAGSGSSPSGSSASVGVTCTRVGGSSSLGSNISSSDSSSSSGGVYECVVDLNAVLPGLRNSSMLLEVTGGGVSRTVPRFASSLSVHALESQGQIQAYCSQGRGSALAPAAAVYVKVFARDASGDEFFYKDGYTDLRGRFDYVTLTSTADMSHVVRYSLLVACGQQGAVMLQAAAPPK